MPIAVFSPSPRLRGEGRGEGPFHAVRAGVRPVTRRPRETARMPTSPRQRGEVNRVFAAGASGAYRWLLLFPVFGAGANSIVIRLIGPFEFVDRRENSIDPLSNEFDSQQVEIKGNYTQP
jgi:hypothetical protein